MSNSVFSRDKSSAQKPDDDAAHEEEQRRNAENVKQFEKLSQNVEAEVLAIIQDLMKKCGQPFTDRLNTLLECSICKGLFNVAVTRHRCLHTYCSDCLTHWTISSKECPMCRDDFYIHAKNPIIDKIVNLLVDFSFTEKEKGERSNEIQQQLPSARTAHFHSIENRQGEQVIQEFHPDTSIPGRMVCVTMAYSLVYEILPQFKSEINSKSSIPDILLELHVEMLNRDWNSLVLIFNRIPKSVLTASFLK